VRIWDAHTGQAKRLIKGHGSAVTAVAFSPDGKTMASASLDKSIALWETATAKELRRFEGHQSGVNAIAFSPDGMTLLSGSRKAQELGLSSSSVIKPGSGDFLDKDNSLRIWDVVSGKARHVLPGPKNGIHAIVWASGGNAVAVIGAENTLHLYDAGTGKELWQGGGQLPWVRRAVFATDGKTLITSGDTTLLTWETSTGKLVQTAAGHSRCVAAVVFAPNGKTAATGGWDHSIRIWDVAKGEERFVLNGHDGGIMSLAFSPDGTLLASASEDRTIRLWDANTGKESGCLKGHGDFVVAAGFSQDGKALVSAGVDRTMRVWDVASGRQLFNHPLKAQTRISHVAVAPDGKHVALVNLEGKPANESVIRVFSTDTGKEVAELAAGQFSVSCLAFSTNGKLLAGGSRSDSTSLWDWQTAAPPRVLKGQKGDGQGSAVAFSDDDCVLASCGADQSICIWELATGQERQRLAGNQVCYSLAFDQGGKRLASGYFNSTALVWDLRGTFAGTPPRPALTPERRNALWEDLQGGDAVKAYQAILEFCGESQQTVAFIRDRLQLVSAEDMAQIDGLIRDLDSDKFTTRERSMHKLEALGATATKLLTEALAAQPNAEVRGRIQRLLAALKQQHLKGEALRTFRATEVLEQIGTHDARQALLELVSRCPWIQPAEQAKAALQRLGRAY
jgi:WD40 repeat protein